MDQSPDIFQTRTNLPIHNDLCVMVEVHLGKICRAMMVSCVHKCLENVNLCHLKSHARDCNDSVDERVGSSREMGQGQQGRNDEWMVFEVQFQEVVAGYCFVDDCLVEGCLAAGGLFQRVG